MSDEYSEFLKDCQIQKERIKAKQASFVVSADSKAGLNKEYVGNITEAAADGNFNIKVAGKNRNGVSISTDFEEASFKTRIDATPGEDEAHRAANLFKIMEEVLDTGVVVAREVTSEMLSKAIAIAVNVKRRLDERRD